MLDALLFCYLVASFKNAGYFTVLAVFGEAVVRRCRRIAAAISRHRRSLPTGALLRRAERRWNGVAEDWSERLARLESYVASMA